MGPWAVLLAIPASSRGSTYEIRHRRRFRWEVHCTRRRLTTGGAGAFNVGNAFNMRKNTSKHGPAQHIHTHPLHRARSPVRPLARTPVRSGRNPRSPRSRSPRRDRFNRCSYLLYQQWQRRSRSLLLLALRPVLITGRSILTSRIETKFSSLNSFLFEINKF